jgi:hypothetical protein
MTVNPSAALPKFGDVCFKWELDEATRCHPCDVMSAHACSAFYILPAGHCQMVLHRGPGLLHSNASSLGQYIRSDRWIIYPGIYGALRPTALCPNATFWIACERHVPQGRTHVNPTTDMHMHVRARAHMRGRGRARTRAHAPINRQW